ncbi:flagellar export chaperone FliS [Anaeromicropila herbilytica]|uniref:Flagellar protein FliS n=1 Tax=Anaeromicropila herbilytica TaxID=2785025 RepID=A0A7R7EQ87_9FIRM|nr:flagellar protein FliS [Anaeromicropila herbilytica]BCN32952.1 hypothetical protein bsdtb5_42470 [Anaeromicropila herbilytica]
MNKESLQIYTARVTQGSRSDLVLVMYDVILEDLETAEKAYNDGDIDTFEHDLKHAQKFLNELMGTLDYKYVMALDLVQLYIYANKKIITAIIKREIETLSTVKKVMSSLRVGFEGVAKEDTSGPIMQNSQKIYAGLTYGKGTLNESFFDIQEGSRGFKA